MDLVFSETLLLSSAVFPLLLALMLALRTLRAAAQILAPWAALPALIATAFTPLPSGELHLPWLLLGSRFGLDATGGVFWTLAAVLWTVSGVYAKHYIKAQQRSAFFLFFLLALAGNLLLILARDIPGFYFGFTLMSLASYGLIVSNKSAPAFRAGRLYILLVILGETALFSAMIMAVHLTGATTFEAVRTALAKAENAEMILWLLFIGFGIKAGVFGLHVWLPLAHPVAPAPASAVLSGTMIKAGLLGWIRLFPVGTAALPEWGSGLIVYGLFTAFYGAAVGMTQRDPKTLLAYSSISQMGIMTMIFGLGLSAPDAWPLMLSSIAFYALHHGLSKGALFLGSGLCGGERRALRRWIWAGLWLPALAMAGAPWSSGMYAKLLAKSASAYAPEALAPLLPLLLSASTVATALMMTRFLYLLRPASAAYGSPPMPGMLRPWALLLIGIVLLPWLQGTATGPMTAQQFLQSFWPILSAVAAAFVVLRTEVLHAIIPVPAGDLLLPMEYAARQLQRTAGTVAARLSAWRKRASARIRMARMRLVNTLISVHRQSERRLTQWAVAVTLFLIILLAMIGSQSI
ncbi:MAG: proton-conducting transporter membrane subunit [Campylobacterales bacterium]|jgi:formate hydrogenlyase subunit 3/multisubunit Na+/H+ antiporter MnhD subunit